MPERVRSPAAMRLARNASTPAQGPNGRALRAGATRAAALTVALLAVAACAAPRRPPAAPSPSRVDVFAIDGGAYGLGQRTIRVFVPIGYEGGTTAYPVLYLQDAQQLFTPGLYGDWRVDETLDRLATSGEHPGLIVVGIDNGRRRWDEYGPWPNRRMHRWVDSSWARATEGGRASAYLGFVVNTLKPEIDRRYRTLPHREHTGVGGSSMGGLFALYATLERPDVFSKAMAMSTAVWFAEEGDRWLSENRLLRQIRAGIAPRNVRFYLDVGTRERSRGNDPDVRDASGEPVTYARAYVEGSQAVAEALRAGGVAESNLRFVVDTGAPHHESAWERRLGPAITWLYR